MTANKTTVTHPDNTVSTRTSKTRAYTHAIEIAPASAVDYAAYLLSQADRKEAEAMNLRTAASLGKGTIRSRGFRTQDDHVSYVATLDGTDVYAWCGEDRLTKGCGDEGLVPVLPYLIRSARANADRADERAAKLRAEAAEVLAAGKPVGGYDILRWSSRADLAHSALGEFAHYQTRGHRLRVVPVD